VTLETNYAKRNLKEIRRTYFVVNTKGAGYEFQVTRQMYLK
jgi:Holliday junction resolvasome RuvABC DNA-binding subunit